MINEIPNGKAVALTGDNNTQSMQCEIAQGNYTHVFTSPEIALSKKFKKNVLDNSFFTDRLCLLAIDEIHLVEQWGRSFRPLYAEIEKVRKRIPCHIPLLGVSATLTKKTRMIVVDKSGFHPFYKLMQTSLDRPEIMQVHRFMEHSKGSCLDLQFVLPAEAKEARDIQKTIIFVNRVSEIRPLCKIFQDWMQMKGFPRGSQNWVRPYYATMSEYDKSLTAEAFRIPGNENQECVILIATDAYGMGIDNPDIKLVIQWDIPVSFDAMIQRIGRAGRKGQKAVFIFLSPGWSRIADPKELEDRLAKRAGSNTLKAYNFCDDNRPTKPAVHRPSPLSQIAAVNEAESDIESNIGSDIDFDQEGFDQEDSDLLTALLGTEAEEKKTSKRVSKSDAAKRALLPDEIFDYIHTAKCRRLFSLAWYDDFTYAAISDSANQLSAKALPSPCCNGPSCLSLLPNFLSEREPFIKTTSVTYSEAEQEWAIYRTSELKKWRTAASIKYWAQKHVTRSMPESLLMPDACLLALAKNALTLTNIDILNKFLDPWYGVSKFSDEILTCIQQTVPGPELLPGAHLGSSVPSRPERRAMLQAARASKKLQYLDDPVKAAASRLINRRDAWQMQRGKPTPATKLRIKKAADQAKREKKNEQKRLEKAKEKAQANDIRRLAISNANRQAEIGSYQAILSDPTTEDQEPTNLTNPRSNKLDKASNLPLATPIAQTPATIQAKSLGMQQIKARLQGKQITASTLAERLNRRPLQQIDGNARRTSPPIGTLTPRTPPPGRSSTPPPVQMELIRPGKRKIKVTANAVESTPPKRMRIRT